MKYIVFLMLDICAGCSGQNKNETNPHGPVGNSLQVFSGVEAGPAQYDCDAGGNCTLKDHTWGSVTGLIPADRFANCVTSTGIHYCPEGRYVQIPEVDPPSPVAPTYGWNGKTTPLADPNREWHYNSQIACPLNSNCKVLEDGALIVTPDPDPPPFSGSYDGNIQTYSQSCAIDAGGLFVCDSPAPTTKKDPKGPPCSLWGLASDDELTVYCGDHEANPDEIEHGKVMDGIAVFHEGDKDAPKHKSSETKPKEREFYPPDADKGPQLLKADIRIDLMRALQSIWGT